MNSPRRNATRRVTVGLACGLCLLFAIGCASKQPPRPGGATGAKADKARKEAEMLAVNTVNAGASQQAKSVPEIVEARKRSFLWGLAVWNPATQEFEFGGSKTNAHAQAPPPPALPGPIPPPPPDPVAKGPPRPKSSLRPGSPPVIRERVVNTVLATTVEEAEEDVLAIARDTVERKLAELDPPVRYKPSVEEVKAEFLRKDSRSLRAPDEEAKQVFELTGKNVVYVEYDVEVTVDQVRELRTQERVSAGLRILGVVVAIVLTGFLFLRADEWTKGYLTSWLALGAIALAGGAAAALIFV